MERNETQLYEQKIEKLKKIIIIKSGNAFNGTNTVYDLAHRIQLSNKKSKKKMNHQQQQNEELTNLWRILKSW